MVAKLIKFTPMAVVRSKAINRIDRYESPIYAIGEAARFIGIPTITLRSWVNGRTYPPELRKKSFDPLIYPPDQSGLLSFNNLVEAHILSVIRYIHDIDMRKLRAMLDHLMNTRQSSRHPLLGHEFVTDGKDVFIETLKAETGKNFECITKYGQFAIDEIVRESLDRIDRDTISQMPTQFYPFILKEKTIAINPRISSGRPVVAGKGILAKIIYQRVMAGETVDDVARDYRLTAFEVQKAIEYTEETT